RASEVTDRPRKSSRRKHRQKPDDQEPKSKSKRKALPGALEVGGGNVEQGPLALRQRDLDQEVAWLGRRFARKWVRRFRQGRAVGDRRSAIQIGNGCEQQLAKLVGREADFITLCDRRAVAQRDTDRPRIERRCDGRALGFRTGAQNLNRIDDPPPREPFGSVAVRCAFKIDEESADRDHRGQAYDNGRPDPGSDRIRIEQPQASAPITVTTPEKT